MHTCAHCATCVAMPPRDDDFLAPPQAKRRHLGELARLLREAAGLTRRELGEQVDLSVETLRNFETAKHLPTLTTLNRLIPHPAMRGLVEWALAEGVAMPAPPEPDGAAKVYVLIRRKRPRKMPC